MQTIAIDPYDDERKGTFGTAIKAPLSISHEQDKVHKGYFFTTATLYVAVANAANVDYCITTPDTTNFSHFNAELDAAGETKIYVFEGVTYSGGSAKVPVNQNRNSAIVSTLTCIYGATITGYGTTLLSTGAGAGAIVSARNKKFISQNNLILKRNTIYLFRMTNASGAAGYIAPTFSWYEHTNE